MQGKIRYLLQILGGSLANRGARLSVAASTTWFFWRKADRGREERKADGIWAVVDKSRLDSGWEGDKETGERKTLWGLSSNAQSSAT